MHFDRVEQDVRGEMGEPEAQYPRLTDIQKQRPENDYCMIEQSNLRDAKSSTCIHLSALKPWYASNRPRGFSRWQFPAAVEYLDEV